MIREDILNKAIELNQFRQSNVHSGCYVDATVYIKIGNLHHEIIEMCGSDEDLAVWYSCLALNLIKEEYELAEQFKNKILEKQK